MSDTLSEAGLPEGVPDAPGLLACWPALQRILSVLVANATDDSVTALLDELNAGARLSVRLASNGRVGLFVRDELLFHAPLSSVLPAAGGEPN